MAERTMQISERDRWTIWIVAMTMKPNSFDEVRKLNRIWDAFDIEAFVKMLDTKKPTPEQLKTEPVEVKCEEAAYNYLLSQFEPTLAKLNPQGPVKLLSSDLLALHERLTKDEAK